MLCYVQICIISEGLQIAGGDFAGESAKCLEDFVGLCLLEMMLLAFGFVLLDFSCIYIPR